MTSMTTGTEQEFSATLSNLDTTGEGSGLKLSEDKLGMWPPKYQKTIKSRNKRENSKGLEV